MKDNLRLDLFDQGVECSAVTNITKMAVAEFLDTSE